jgi:hypothetical protein
MKIKIKQFRALIIFCILVVIFVFVSLNIQNNEKLKELEAATNNLAAEIKHFQYLASNNITLFDYGSKVERGYAYVFFPKEKYYHIYEILADKESSPLGNFNYYWLDNKDFGSAKINIENIKITDQNLAKAGMGSFVRDSKNVFNLPVASAADEKIAINLKQFNFLFPNGQMQFLDYYADQENVCNGTPCGNFIIYLRHSEIDNRLGQIIINRETGSITVNIVPMPK